MAGLGQPSTVSTTSSQGGEGIWNQDISEVGEGTKASPKRQETCYAFPLPGLPFYSVNGVFDEQTFSV